MTEVDHYATLGLNRFASSAAIKKAYRELALRHHPDKNPNDTAASKRFQSITDSYSVLSDVHAKSSYDTQLFAANHTGSTGLHRPSGYTSSQQRTAGAGFQAARPQTAGTARTSTGGAYHQYFSSSNKEQKKEATPATPGSFSYFKAKTQPQPSQSSSSSTMPRSDDRPAPPERPSSARTSRQHSHASGYTLSDAEVQQLQRMRENEFAAQRNADHYAAFLKSDMKSFRPASAQPTRNAPSSNASSVPASQSSASRPNQTRDEGEGSKPPTPSRDAQKSWRKGFGQETGRGGGGGYTTATTATRSGTTTTRSSPPKPASSPTPSSEDSAASSLNIPSDDGTSTTSSRDGMKPAHASSSTSKSTNASDRKKSAAFVSEETVNSVLDAIRLQREELERKEQEKPSRQHLGQQPTHGKQAPAEQKPAPPMGKPPTPPASPMKRPFSAGVARYGYTAPQHQSGGMAHPPTEPLDTPIKTSSRNEASEFLGSAEEPKQQSPAAKVGIEPEEERASTPEKRVDPPPPPSPRASNATTSRPPLAKPLHSSTASPKPERKEPPQAASSARLYMWDKGDVSTTTTTTTTAATATSANGAPSTASSPSTATGTAATPKTTSPYTRPATAGSISKPGSGYASQGARSISPTSATSNSEGTKSSSSTATTATKPKGMFVIPSDDDIAQLDMDSLRELLQGIEHKARVARQTVLCSKMNSNK